jgi:hypothetical protein
MKPRHTAEQSTVSVNKAQQIGKLGFAALKFKKETDIGPQPFSAPLQKTLDMNPQDLPEPVKALGDEPTGPLFSSVVSSKPVQEPVSHNAEVKAGTQVENEIKNEVKNNAETRSEKEKPAEVSKAPHAASSGKGFAGVPTHQTQNQNHHPQQNSHHQNSQKNNSNHSQKNNNHQSQNPNPNKNNQKPKGYISLENFKSQM